MLRLLEAEKKKLLGIISTNGWSGPRSLTFCTVPAFFDASFSYVSCNLFFIASGTLSPGFSMLTVKSPIVTATVVVPM